jgi:hypothetical protein
MFFAFTGVFTRKQMKEIAGDNTDNGGKMSGLQNFKK